MTASNPFEHQPHLTGEIVALRPTVAEDWEPLYALASDPLVWELHPAWDRHQEAVFRPYFEEGLASGLALTAIDRASGRVAGWSRFSDGHVLPGEMEIGWTFLGRAYWGGAHNSDMKRLMLDHAFRFVDQVIFRVGDQNLRSRRAVEKLGAVLTDRFEISGEGERQVKMLFYAIDRDTWGRRRGATVA